MVSCQAILNTQINRVIVTLSCVVHLQFTADGLMHVIQLKCMNVDLDLSSSMLLLGDSPETAAQKEPNSTQSFNSKNEVLHHIVSRSKRQQF